jgi:hypothetical protein
MTTGCIGERIWISARALAGVVAWKAAIIVTPRTKTTIGPGPSKEREEFHRAEKSGMPQEIRVVKQAMVLSL